MGILRDPDLLSVLVHPFTGEIQKHPALCVEFLLEAVKVLLVGIELPDVPPLEFFRRVPEQVFHRGCRPEDNSILIDLVDDILHVIEDRAKFLLGCFDLTLGLYTYLDLAL